MTVEKGNKAGISVEATTTSGVARSGGERSEPERSDAPDVAPPDPAPDPEVQEKAVRRQFSAKYKARILEKADACKGKHGALGKLLRKEGLYASQVAAWRKQREKGQLQGLGPKKRGRKGSGKPQKSQREKELEREVRRLNRRNDKLELMIEIQKKNFRAPGDPDGTSGPRREELMGAVEKHRQLTGTKPACEAMGVARSTYYRRRAAKIMTVPRRPRPTPARALASSERQEVLTLLHSEQFMDQAPGQVVATLLDKKKYLCSERTMYRILACENEVRERRNQLRHPNYKRPELLATGPNQVWSWDITKLRGPIKWSYFHLYVLLDIYSRYVVGWLLAHRESADLAKRLIADSCAKQDIAAGQLNIHADRGTSMTSKALAQLMTDLGVDKSHSRPHVSNDNPFSESQFKTLKYRPEYPNRFGSFEDALAFCRRFFDWYNTQHRHSGIKMLTPEMVHYGRAEEVLTSRHRVMMAARAAHPERFVRGTPQPVQAPTAVWINPPRSLLAMNREVVELVIPQHQASQDKGVETPRLFSHSSSSSMEALH